MKGNGLVWLLFIFLSLTWGSSFILIKKSMFPVSEEDMVFNPYHVGALRIVIAGLLLLPFALKNLRHLKGKKVWFLLVAGTCGNLLPSMLFPLAETHIESSLAGLLNSTTSFFVVLIGVFFFKSKPSAVQLIGLVLGSLGLFLVLRSQLGVSSKEDLAYALIVLPATLCYAISLTTIKFKLQEFKPLTITSLSFFLVFIPALGIAFFSGAFQQVVQHPDGFKALGYLSVLAGVGTALAVMLFTKLISISSPIFSSAVAYMLPIVAISIGVLLGEDFPLVNLAWGALIILGVLLMNQPGFLRKRKDI